MSFKLKTSGPLILDNLKTFLASPNTEVDGTKTNNVLDEMGLFLRGCIQHH
jgi:hypothetical protein